MVTGRDRAHYQVTFAVLALGVAAYALLQSLVIPVLTTVQHELHTTQAAVTWVLTAYLLSASIIRGDAGRAGRRVAAGGGRAVDRRHDRGTGDPGGGRRHAAPGVRDHQG
jgi:MFS family permease